MVRLYVTRVDPWPLGCLSLPSRVSDQAWLAGQLKEQGDRAMPAHGRKAHRGSLGPAHTPGFAWLRPPASIDMHPVATGLVANFHGALANA